MYKMKLVFVALFFLLADMESVGTNEDFVVHYYHKNISTIDILERLNMSYTSFDVHDIKSSSFEYSCQTVCPLNNEDQERKDEKQCSCDKSCVELGDCCFDYFLRCRAANTTHKPQVPKVTCVKYSSPGNHGYVMIGSCPLHNTDKNLESLCTSSKADFFGRMLPVSDLQSKTTYKNEFCAMCNQASNLTYWNFSAKCEGHSSLKIPTNRSLMLAFVMTNCKWNFTPPLVQNEKLCLDVKQNCPDSELVDEVPLLRDLCSFYAFPVCTDFQTKNPHCDICRGKNISAYLCKTSIPISNLISAPSWEILFDFSSTSHSRGVREKKSKECARGFVFDPFNEACVKIHYSWSVYPETETLVSTEITPLQILTNIGCTISVISLIFLLVIYVALPELRTLPGKNLMNLSFAMLLYHVFFLLTGQTDKPNLCMSVSVLLHYFLMSSFCWMGVMAFDVEKTFAAKGKVRPSHRENRKALVKYNMFAWITPAVVVVTSVTLDKTNTVSIGYAEVFCWISNGRALLLVFGVPVAIILLFNVGALTLTMISIRKTQKSTRRVTEQKNQTSLPVLCIKLSSTMGFTWILGFIAPFTKVEFLSYLFVILNTLQGFFIFLVFVADKRTINKVRAGWMARFHRVKNADRATPLSRENDPSKLVTSTL